MSPRPPWPRRTLGRLALLVASATGLAGAGTAMTLGPSAPAASAGALTTQRSCADLLSWFQDRALHDVRPGRAPLDRAYAEAQPAEVGSSATGTTGQEPGVDEPDLAKTDGRRVVFVRAGRLEVTDVTGTSPRRLGSVALPEGVEAVELLLVGDRAVLAGQRPTAVTIESLPQEPVRPGMPWSRPLPAPRPEFLLLVVDLADPTRPRLARMSRWSDRLVSLRSHGDVVRVVTATRRPGPLLDQPRFGGRGLTSGRESAQVLSSTIADWLPTRNERPLVPCDRVWTSAGPGHDTIVVTAFHVDHPEDRTSTGVVADADLAYSSADRLVVAARAGSRTELHSFRLDGTQSSYAGSGTVPGEVRDRWSLDEDRERLRVAWTRRGQVQESGISVLIERDGRLTTVGRVEGIGRGEDVQAVRWLGDVAVVVTFRRVDPLHVVDLTDPTRPRLRGELEVPGWSGYLHPIGGSLLLGLGVDADVEGRESGAAASVFDLTDLDHPSRVAHVSLGRDTHVPAGEDPRAFTWLPGPRVALAPLRLPYDGASPDGSLVSLRVDRAGTLTTRRTVGLTSPETTRTLPLADGRVAVVSPDLGAGTEPASVRLLAR